MKLVEKIKKFFGMYDGEVILRVTGIDEPTRSLMEGESVNALVEGKKLSVDMPDGFIMWYQHGDELVDGNMFERIAVRFDTSRISANDFVPALQSVLSKHGLRTDISRIRAPKSKARGGTQ